MPEARALRRVLVVGLGGLGCPALSVLARVPELELWLCDDDVVELTNLHRQTLYRDADVGHDKLEAAQQALIADGVAPERLVAVRSRLLPENARQLVSQVDLVLEGADNFATRFLVNDACFFARKSLISASMFRFEGQLTTIKPHAGYPCYRCLYPEPPPAGLVPNCQEAGVLGVLAGTMGILQASEAIKEILGIGETLADKLLIYDALEMKFRKVGRPKDPACPLCGPNPSIKDLSSDYTVSCSI